MDFLHVLKRPISCLCQDCEHKCQEKETLFFWNVLLIISILINLRVKASHWYLNSSPKNFRKSKFSLSFFNCPRPVKRFPKTYLVMLLKINSIRLVYFKDYQIHSQMKNFNPWGNLNNKLQTWKQWNNRNDNTHLTAYIFTF